jgi:hypothetical protein
MAVVVVVGLIGALVAEAAGSIAKYPGRALPGFEANP